MVANLRLKSSRQEHNLHNEYKIVDSPLSDAIHQDNSACGHRAIKWTSKLAGLTCRRGTAMKILCSKKRQLTPALISVISSTRKTVPGGTDGPPKSTCTRADSRPGGGRMAGIHSVGRQQQQQQQHRDNRTMESL
jgi:hypothetical protein